MGLLKHADVYWKFLGQCTQCGYCTSACASLTENDMTLGAIARALLEAERNAGSPEELRDAVIANPALYQAVRGCFFCTSCKNTCFAHNDVCELIYHARVDFLALGLIPREAYSSVMVDEEWDIFTAYRAIYGIGFADLTRHLAREGAPAQTDCDVVFFPGCSMAAYGPELTREIFAALEECGAGKVTMLDSCCGSSLKSAGFYERAEALCERNAAEIKASGAKQLVCVCPGCANDMGKALAACGMDVEVASLSAFLASHGFAPKRPLPATPLVFSKSCQDRDGRYLDETRAILGVSDEAPAVFRGCCGAGGAVSAFSPERQAAQADSKLSFVPDGATVVTMCPTCTYTYAFRQMNAPRDIRNKHYAELLFESQFDWDRNFAQLGGMWYGEYGPWLAQVFA